MANNNIGNNFQDYQSAQTQLLNIRAQQNQLLGEQRLTDKARFYNNNVRYEAAGMVADTMGMNSQDANLNPQTQAILNQYGLNQPKTQRTTSSASNQKVTKENITINNTYKTENITTNNVSVPSGGPIQGRGIQVNRDQNIAINKFKSWLTNSMAQQNELAAKRDMEYERRQEYLSRDSAKLIKKLETVGVTIGKSMNPVNIARYTIKPLKALLMGLGFGYLATNWTRLMNFVDRAEIFLTNKNGDFTEFLGGKKGETVLEAIRNLFLDENTGLIAPIKKMMENRAENSKKVISQMKTPEWVRGDGIGVNMKRFAEYLGDVMMAVVNPDKAMSSQTSKNVTAEANKESVQYAYDNRKTTQKRTKVTTENGDTIKTDTGDLAILNGEHKGLTTYALNKDGSLTGTAGSTVSQGNEFARLIGELKNGNQVNTIALTEAITRLYNATENKEDGKVPVSADFVNSIRSLLGEDINLKAAPKGKYIFVTRNKTNEQKNYEFINSGPLWYANPNDPMFSGGLGQTSLSVGNEASRELYKAISRDSRVELIRADEFNPKTDVKISQEVPTIYEITRDDLQNISNRISSVAKGGAELNTNVSNINVQLQEGMKKLAQQNIATKPGTANNTGFSEAMYDQLQYNNTKTLQEQQVQQARDNMRIKTFAGNAKDAIINAGKWVGNEIGLTNGGGNSSEYNYASGNTNYYNDTELNNDNSNNYDSDGELNSDYANIKIVREFSTDGKTIGKIYVNGQYLGDTMELGVDENGNNKLNTAINSGKYKLGLTETHRKDWKKKKWYNKWKKTPELFNTGNRSGIRIHPGNNITDTSGCILVGNYDQTTGTLTDSVNTYDTLMNVLSNSKDMSIEIENGSQVSDYLSNKNTYKGIYESKYNYSGSSSYSSPVAQSTPYDYYSTSSNINSSTFTDYKTDLARLQIAQTTTAELTAQLVDSVNTLRTEIQGLKIDNPTNTLAESYT